MASEVRVVKMEEVVVNMVEMEVQAVFFPAGARALPAGNPLISQEILIKATNNKSILDKNDNFKVVLSQSLYLVLENTDYVPHFAVLNLTLY